MIFLIALLLFLLYFIYYIIFILFFPGFVKAELIKLAKILGLLHETDNAYSISGAPGDYID